MISTASWLGSSATRDLHREHTPVITGTSRPPGARHVCPVAGTVQSPSLPQHGQASLILPATQPPFGLTGVT
jgi:hypothetical protein